MSHTKKIDDAIQAKKLADSFSERAQRILGKGDGHIDKNGMNFSVREWDRQSCRIISSPTYGFYGNSSVTTGLPGDAWKFVGQALNALQGDILNRAVELANLDAKGKAEAAKNELADVMAQIEQGDKP